MEKLLGRIPVRVEVSSDREHMRMFFSDGSNAHWFHYQECCETVEIIDVVGDWADLYGHPLLVAEERTCDDHRGPAPDGLRGPDYNNTWTFYTFRGVGGSVDVRWLGSSNGCYSESVDFVLEEAK